jgi:dihydrofolate synthase/folylpolyglutamate synthase
MLFDEALSYLLSLGHETLAIKLGLTSTERLLQALGNPHTSFPAVQIAGTNGKGSTAVMLDSICRSAGIRTGLFTSPHLVSITERIRIGGRQIAESDFARLTTQVKAAAEELINRGELNAPPTFFEHVTAIALLAFREARAELAILETGLGGRLDSTTAARAEIVAITPIAMDHEEYLGHTLVGIAAEKAATIRPGVTAIVAPQLKEVLDVILSQCEGSGVEPRLVDSGTVVGTSEDGRCCVTFETIQDKYEKAWLGLRGRHQVTNAALAIALAEALRERGSRIAREAVIQGVETANHPGRLELSDGPPRMLFDGAHNPAGARALRGYLDEFVRRPITMIFGAMRDKALGEMTVALLPAADNLILAEFDNPRAATNELLKTLAPSQIEPGRVHYAASADEALKIAVEVTPTDSLICVTGSLYLIGAVQQILRLEPHRIDAQNVAQYPRCLM